MTPTELIELKADLDKADDDCLAAVRRLVSDCLTPGPESHLITRPIVVQILQAWAQNKDIFVRVIITARDNTINPPTFTLTVQTSAVPSAGFIPAKRWLFQWFNAVKDR